MQSRLALVARDYAIFLTALFHSMFFHDRTDLAVLSSVYKPSTREDKAQV